MKPVTVFLLLGVAGCGTKPPTDPTGPANPAPPPILRVGHHLEFQVQPMDARTNKYIAPAVRVAVLDVDSQLVTHQLGGSIDTVTITLEANPGGATLAGRTTAVTVLGVATFPNLRLERQAAGYRLRASSPPLIGTVSNPFTIR